MAIKKIFLNRTPSYDTVFSNLIITYRNYTKGNLTDEKITIDMINEMSKTFYEQNIDYSNFKFIVIDDFGMIVIKLYDFLMNSLEDIEPDFERRKKMVLSNIYVVPKDDYAKDFMHTTLLIREIWNDIESNIIENFLEFKSDMNFDVIIGNPPYQQNFGIIGKNSSNSKSIYNLFMQKAFDMKPKYVVMITPSRYMTKTSQGIADSWVDSVLNCNHFRIIHDFEHASEIFPDVNIAGGINYFVWDREYNGNCTYCYYKTKNEKPLIRIGKLDDLGCGIVVRDLNSYSIINKIEAVEGKYYQNSDKNFSGLVSPKHFFDDSNLLTSNWKGYNSEKTDEFHIKYYITEGTKRAVKWISDAQLPKNKATKDLWKVYIPAAQTPYGNVLGKPLIGEPNSVCSQTFLVIGYNPNKHKLTENNCKNIISYINTKFFRYLITIKKKTQNGPKSVYQFVPLQDFNKPWTDKELYTKYNLSKEEIDMIEKNINPM